MIRGKFKPLLTYLKSSGHSLYKRLFKDRTEVAIFFTAFLVEIAFGLYLIYRWRFTFTCGDAVAHLYIPRTVIDNGEHSHLGNLGTVWLPMFHILVMPLTLIEPLYTTGFAGTIVNSLMTGGICLILYRLVGQKRLGILISVFFLGNVFTLIYGSTSMTEQTAIFFIVLAAYYFKSYWEKDDLFAFMKCGLALIFGTLTRYEVWIVALLIPTFFLIKELRRKRFYRLAYIHFPFWGIFAWLFWNLAIFRDPFAFITHPMSAQTQAKGSLLAWSVLPTLNLTIKQLNSVMGYAWIFSLFLFILPFFLKNHLKASSSMLASILLSPILFQIIMCYLSSSLGWARGFYLGITGFILIPFLIIKENGRTVKKTKIAILTTLLALYLFALPTGVEIVSSGSYSSIGYPQIKIEAQEFSLIKGVVGDNMLLMKSFATYSSLSGTSPSKIYDDYDNPIVIEVGEEPWRYVDYVLIEKFSPSDPWLKLWNDYWEGKFFLYRYFNDLEWKTEFLEHYKLVLETEHFLLFQIKTVGS